LIFAFVPLVSLFLFFTVNIAGANALSAKAEKVAASSEAASGSEVSPGIADVVAERRKRIEIERRLSEVERLVSRVLRENRVLSDRTSRLLEENRSLKETILSLKDVVAEKRAGSFRASPLSPAYKPASAPAARRKSSSARVASFTPRGLDLAPSNPTAMPGTAAGQPGGTDSLFLSSEMLKGLLPGISNLEIGYSYYFGKQTRTGRLSVDYLLPVGIGIDGGAFGEVHAECTHFWNSLRSFFRREDVTGMPPTNFSTTVTTTTGSGVYDRTDLSLGAGFRKIFAHKLLIGVNAFYDTSRLGSKWYGSGSLGLEMVSLLSGSDALDLNFNLYGDLFQGRNSIVNAFRNGPGNFDLEIGYSHELGDSGPDLRLKLRGYKFDVGTAIWGWNAGAEVTTRNAAFSVKAEAGRDEINDTYYMIGGFVNVGIQFEKLARGESPFTTPEPIFKSPRNLRRLLSAKVRRNYHQPASVLVTQALNELGPGCELLIASQTTDFPSLSEGGQAGLPLHPSVPGTDSDPATEVIVLFGTPSPNWDGGHPFVDLRRGPWNWGGANITIPPNSSGMRITNSNFWMFGGMNNNLTFLRIHNGTCGWGDCHWDPGVVTVLFLRCHQ
jgi:hypothetical protein